MSNIINENFIQEYWISVAEQDKNKLRSFFDSKAIINWHDSNEQFTLEEYIIANCEYPGLWSGEIERIEWLNDKAITVTRVSSDDRVVYAVSFFEFHEDKIILLDEYWSESDEPPQWRIDKKIGVKINE